MFSVSQTTRDYMSLVVTHDCTMRCPFCVDAYRGSGEYMSLDTAAKALEFGREHGIKDVLLIGGEPTMHPEIETIAQMAKRAGFRVILTTNYTDPGLVRKLDGCVDCFNISYYRQPVLPRQADFRSDLTLHALIHAGQLGTRAELDDFIDRHSFVGHLKFSTLVPCTPWAARHQAVPYLDALDCEWVTLFDEIAGQLYRGAVIKRYDRILNPSAHQSFKAHVDGTITQTWDRPGVPKWSARRSAEPIHAA